MNFQQLRIFRETIRRNFNLTEVASALMTSQSGVSKHIKDIEDELGVELFIRRGKRFLGLSEPGRQIAGIVERILIDAGNIKSIAVQLGQRDEGNLVIATTHNHARYALPKVILAFRQAYPNVRFVVHQSSPAEITAMLLQGHADIGIATESVTRNADLAVFPYYFWHHTVIVPKLHPLASCTELTLPMIAQYPVITYHDGFTGRPAVDRAFAKAGLELDIVMSALDADVIKAYVELGLGVGIVASMAVDPERDSALAVLPAQHLFEENTSHIALRRGRFLRGFAYRFIELCRPTLTEAVVRQEMAERSSLE